MNKIKTVKIKNEDGSISQESYNISADARNIDMTNGYNVQETIGTIDVENDGSIANQLNNINDKVKKKTYYFNTVVDMKAASLLNKGDYVITLGYHNLNDGGNARYIIKDSNDGYSEILQNGLYAKLIYEHEHNPFQFGAYCDGIHDDAVAIRKGINFLNSYHGGILNLLNNHVYLINSRENADTFFYLKDNCDIIGKSTLKIANNFGEWNYFFWHNSGINKITLKDFIIDENTVNNPPTENTGSDVNHSNRIIFRLINNRGNYLLNDLVFNNITINDCFGRWQYEFEGKCENVKIENCKINYSLIETEVNFDKTSCYLGTNNCHFINNILNGTNNTRTAIELHGHNIICANNIVTGFNTGIHIVNDPTNPSNADNKFIHVYDNKIFTRRNGIDMVLVFQNMHTECIDIHDNDINIIESNLTIEKPLGIGTLFGLGNNSSVKTINIHHNNIYSNKANCDMISFESSNNNIFYIKNLIIENNNIDGYYDRAIRLSSNAHNTFCIDNININNNKFTLNNDTNFITFFLLRDGIKNLMCLNNSFILNNYNFDYLFRITTPQGSNPPKVSIKGTFLDQDILPNKIYSGSLPILLEHTFSILQYTTSAGDSTLDMETFQIANGSYLKDSNNMLYRIDSQWVNRGIYHIETPKHIYGYKGDVYECITSENVIFKKVTQAGFFPDHIVGTELNKVGEWVTRS